MAALAIEGAARSGVEPSRTREGADLAEQRGDRQRAAPRAPNSAAWPCFTYKNIDNSFLDSADHSPARLSLLWLQRAKAAILMGRHLQSSRRAPFGPQQNGVGNPLTALFGLLGRHRNGDRPACSVVTKPRSARGTDMLDKPTKDMEPEPGWRFPRFLPLDRAAVPFRSQMMTSRSRSCVRYGSRPSAILRFSDWWRCLRRL